MALSAGNASSESFGCFLLSSLPSFFFQPENSSRLTLSLREIYVWAILVISGQKKLFNWRIPDCPGLGFSSQPGGFLGIFQVHPQLRAPGLSPAPGVLTQPPDRETEARTTVLPPEQPSQGLCSTPAWCGRGCPGQGATLAPVTGATHSLPQFPRCWHRIPGEC